jgi:hypothetical protein
MEPFALLAIFALMLLVAGVVSAPLRAGRAGTADAREQAERDDLEAGREAKYREIRDAELDRDTGKLSDEDWRTLDRQLRAEAVDILRRLDEIEP